MAKISFHEITKQFPNASKPAVNAVTFEVAENSTCMLVSTSGSGKTTLLRMVNRLIEPTSGEIVIDGKNVLEELPDVLIALALVTGRARERQVAHAVGAIVAAWMNVVEFEGNVAGVTVDTLVIPLEQHVLPHFIACQRPLLVLRSLNIRIL